MTDEDALMAAILADPDDDLPRQVYADWLQEHAGTIACLKCDGAGWRTVRTRTAEMDGNEWSESNSRCDRCDGTGCVPDLRADRAEFIRVQIELARGCGKCSPNRTVIVWAQYDPFGADIPPNGYIEPCPRCGESGKLESRAAELLDAGPEWAVSPGGFGEVEWEFSRGFVHFISLKQEHFIKYAPELARHPITRVALTDRQPLPCAGGYTWVLSSDELPSARIHPVIYNRLVGMVFVYESQEDAMVDLSDACVSYLRSLRRRCEVSSC